MHLRGMDQIISSASNPALSDYRIHLMEVMAIMDMSTFTIGRQTTGLNIWKRNCSSGAPYSRSRRSDVEPMSGLPRSLLDLMCEIDIESTEMHFWNWPGAQGSFVQLQLWEAYRSAAILSFRQAHLRHHAAPPTQSGAKAPPSTAVLLSRVLSCLDAIVNASRLTTVDGPASINAILYPAVIAGLTIDIMRVRSDWQEVIRSCLIDTSQQHGHQNRLLLSLLEELWERDDDALDIDALLSERGLELCLL